MPFDRAAILREAHDSVRTQRAERLAANPNAYLGPYRKSFAYALRFAWRRAKEVAAIAAYEASLKPIPADVAARIRAIETDAWFAPITSRGNDEYSALMAQASLMRDAARAGLTV